MNCYDYNEAHWLADYYGKMNAYDVFYDYQAVNLFFDLNDLERLKWIIKRHSVNSSDINGYTFLHVVVEEQKREAFDYLISLEDINLKCHNFIGQTPLTLACLHDESYFVKTLIENGADVNQCDVDGTSPLCNAIRTNHLEAAKLLLENGADVNYMSPFYLACMYNNYDAIYMLLFYGALVSMVEHSLLMDFMANAPFDCLETLLLHYLDEIDKVDLDFVSMIIRRKFELFPVVLEKITEVDCDSGELFCYIYDVEHLIALLKKFPEFKEFFFQEFRVSPYFPDDSESLETFTKLIFKLAEESWLFSDFLGTFESEIILRIILCYKEFNMCKDKLTELILILTSYGFPLYFEDFLLLHSYVGNGLLVKFYLHNTMHDLNIKLHRDWLFKRIDLMGLLLYKPNFDFDCNITESSSDIMSDILFDLANPISGFRYFANSKFLKFVSKVYPKNRGVKVLLQQPHFPKLIELSRNVCQKFIYSNYEISHDKPGKYYYIVERLEIPDYYKEILTFDVELYAV